MSDVFSPTWVLNLAAINAAGLVSAQLHLVNAAGSADVAYYNVGIPRNVNIAAKPLTKKDSLLRDQTYAYEITWEFETLFTHVALLKDLPAIVRTGIPAEWKLKTPDGKYFVTNADTAPLATRFEFMNPGDLDDFRYIKWTIEGTVQLGEVAAMFTSSPPADGTQTVGDILYAALHGASYNADAEASIIDDIQFKALPDTDYAHLGDFRTAKLSVSCLGEKGGSGRNLFRTTGFKVTLDVMGLQTSLVEMGLLPDVGEYPIDTKVHFASDGATLALGDGGFQMSIGYNNKGDVDKLRELPIKVEGSVYDLSTWSGLWS